MDVSIKGSKFTLNGKPTQLAGNHTWDNVQRIEGEKTGIDKVTGNFTRLWTIETRGAVFSQSIWGSNTEGLVSIQDLPWKSDGSLNKRYYKSLEETVKKAERRDIVTGVVLFEGSISGFPTGWDNHVFNGLGPESPDQVHTRGHWNRFQREHVKKVVKMLELYDNVIYEVGNELMASSTGWFQPWVVKMVKKWTDKPVGVSYARGIRASNGRNESAWMLRTGADWFAPTYTAIRAGQFSRVKKPIVFDTDHSWPLRSNVPGMVDMWNRGHNILLMDGFDGTMLRNQGSLAPDRDFINSALITS